MPMPMGKKSGTAQTISFAMYLPTRNVSQSWSLNSQASIYSVELQAIHLALKCTYKLNESASKGIIFCDSSPVVKSITSTTPGNNEATSDQGNCSLDSSGNRTSLNSLLSHVSKEGNEEADKWAQSEFAQPSGTKADHCLSPSEINRIFKNYLEEKSTNHLKTCQKKLVFRQCPKPDKRITPLQE